MNSHSSATTTTNNAKKWNISAQALFLSASSPNLNYIGSVTSSSANSIQEFYLNKQFQYGAGFNIAASYQYAQSKDISIDWSRYNHNTIKNSLTILMFLIQVFQARYI